MNSAVAELEAGLQGLLTLRPPGVSNSRVNNLTTLCVDNVQSESVLVQKLFTHFKKTPGTHKLGVLYIVDAVTRKWMEQAKAQGQVVRYDAKDGTPAAGVQKVTELMPLLMNDVISKAPEDQKDRIRKLIDIWDKGQTFPASMVESFKAKLNSPKTNASTTPPGSPPPNSMAFLGGAGNRSAGPQQSQPPPPSAMPNIMETLANIARQNATGAQSNPSLTAPAPAPAPAPVSASPHAPLYNTIVGPYSNGAVPLPGSMPLPAQPAMSYLPTSQPAAPPVNFASMFPPPAQPVHPAAAPAPPAQVPAAAPLGGVSSQAHAVQLITALAAQGIPIDKIAGIIQAMGQAGIAGAGSSAGAAPQVPLPAVAPQVPPMPMSQPAQTGYAAPPPPPPPASGGPTPWEMSRSDDARDRNGYHDSMRSPGRPRGRSRSRSPPRGWGTRDSPRTRGHDRGFDYGRPASPPGRGRPDDRGRGGRMQEYRQRSPPGGRRGLSPEREPSQQEKWVEYDNSIPSGSIKVYSRTLFVGGVTCAESELRQIFSRFGQVQTCIVNKDKRHAFVKMYFRKDAEAAKAAMEDPRNQDLQLRTRWGVGFGPRDCSDYQSGVSIIPINKLTDADRKWMLTAPYGGSGGRPIVSGLSVEEPDIEIGAGVSSKAISRRMQTDKGGNHGPKSSRRDDEPGHSPPETKGGEGRGGGRWRHGRDKRNDRGNPNDEPVVLGLPDGITMGPNGINYPANFAFNQ